jgi:hypothetical protein
LISGERISYKKWNSVWRIWNGRVELLVTADVGPRILHFGFKDDENEFYEVPAEEGLTGGEEFRMYGGHRLWVAPETSRTSYPDNHRVEVSQSAGIFHFTAPPETTGLRKSIEIQLAENDARVRVVHRIQNVSDIPLRVTAWALSVLRPGGTAVLPLPPRAPHGPDHLLPVTSLVLWSYTDLTASCWNLGPSHLKLEQSNVSGQGFGMQKLGMINKSGWGAYIRNGHVFTKRIAWREGTYVDGANFETFANHEFLELETLSPDEELPPGGTCTHVEDWSLKKGDLDLA